MINTTIRTLQKNDIPALTKLVASAMPNPWLEKTFHDCTKKNYYGWVLEQYNEIFGFVIILLHFSVCELMNIAIQPEYQRKGYAKRLLRHAINFAKSKHAEKVFLEVRRSNNAAINLSQEFCAVKIGVRKNYFANDTDGEDAIVFKIGLESV